MISTESHRGRRIIARLDRGSDLFDGIRALCKKHRVNTGELRAIGSLESADLAAFDQSERRWKPARTVSGGGLELLHLAGNIAEEDGALAIEARVTLMRDRDSGVEVLGGHLVKARVHSLEVIIESFDDVLLRRQLDPATGLSRWFELISENEVANGSPAVAPWTAATPPPPTTNAAAPRPAATGPAAPRQPMISPPTNAPARMPTTAAPSVPQVSAPAPAQRAPSGNPFHVGSTPDARAAAPRAFTAPAAASPPAATWADVAAASQPPAPTRPGQTRPPDPALEDEDTIVLHTGDVIIHPRFQRCVVHKVEGAGEYVQVLLRNGRIVRLSLDVLRLTPQGTENGQRVFAATVL